MVQPMGKGPLPLVAVWCDGSFDSNVAVRTAATAAVRRGEGLLVITVSRPTATTLSAHTAAEAAAHARGAAIVRRAHELAVETEPEVLVESVVLRDADDPALTPYLERVTQVVLGRRGAGGQAAFSLGSTSHALVHRVQRPLLVPGGFHPSQAPGAQPTDAPVPAVPRPVVRVGFRPKLDPIELLRLAAAEATSRQAPMHVVSCVRGAQDAERVQRAMWSELLVADVSAPLPREVRVEAGEPAEVLCRLSRPHDLLVVGTRGGGTLSGLIRDSVARRLLDEAPCDVLVLPTSVVQAARAAVELPAGAERGT